MKVVFKDGQELECIAIKPFHGSDNEFVVLGRWNEATPFRVYTYSVLTEQQTGSGVYCYDWDSAIAIFNNTGG